MSLLSRARIVIVILAGLAVAIIGITKFVDSSGAPVEASPSVSVDGLTAQVTRAGWTEMDHDMSQDAPGFQMPPAMMPGMPEQGKERLAVAVTVTNTTEGTRSVRPGEEFTLYFGKDGTQVKAQPHTFGELPRLAPRNAVTGTLFFDLPQGELGDSPMWLEWSHGDASTRLSVPLNGSAPDPNHSHNP